MPTNARSAPAPIEQLSAAEARAIALCAQGLTSATAPASVHDTLRLTGAVQLDTISVLARSHELVAYARLGAVPRADVEAAYWGGPPQAFEYSSHANCILPIELWPYFAFRRRAIAERWPAGAGRAIDDVRAHLAAGPITTTEAGGARDQAGWWNWSESKRALEHLYRRGDAVVATRRGWKRVYDLPERVLPRRLRSTDPSDAECYRCLVAQSARALGVGTRRDIANYHRLTPKILGVAPDCRRLVDEAIDANGLVRVRVEGWAEDAFVHPDAVTANPRDKHRTTLLSPFDSLVWDRERTEWLFGFAFLLEAYKPKDQRIHGYFTMPLLSGGRLVGRVDPSREKRTLVARSLSLEDPSAIAAMASALREAATWVGCDDVRIDAAQPKSILRELRRALR